jgi:hypothetical protein
MAAAAAAAARVGPARAPRTGDGRHGGPAMDALSRVVCLLVAVFRASAAWDHSFTTSLAFEPPASGWAQQLRQAHPSHPFTSRLADEGSARSDERTLPPPCPNQTWAQAVQPAGLLSVTLFGAVGNRSFDSAPAVEAAINASVLCGGCVYFPPGEYWFNHTVLIKRGCYKGSAGHGQVDGSSPPQVNIFGPETGGPVIAVIKADSVTMEDLSFHGQYTGVYIGDSAGVRFVNCGVEAGKDGDGIDASITGCNATGCNVVLGSMSAAMVIENSFWLWFERCAFTDQGNSGVCAHPYKPPCDWGQRPTV